MGHLAEYVAQYTLPALFATVGVWFTTRRTNKKVEEVRDLAEPTGNGFAQRVETALKEIREDVREVRIDMNRHLHDHAAGGMAGRPWFTPEGEPGALRRSSP